ncbi:MAG: hypothetical protein DRO00_09325 [Thermoproteota archaeon]|nr:MAG: hypothetical protein DRO00_09325 [Candidatus Korarchaeota archaeon]
MEIGIPSILHLTLPKDLLSFLYLSFISLTLLYVLHRALTNKGFPLLGSIEVKCIPLSYLSDEIQVAERNRAFERFLTSISFQDRAIALRISFVNGDGRIFILTGASNEEELKRELESLKTLTLACFPDFDVKASLFNPELASRELEGAAVQLIGAPILTKDPLRELAEFFVQGHSGEYIVVLKPERPSWLKAALLELKYREATGRAAKQKSERSFLKGQVSKAELDYSASKEQERLMKELERYRAERALRVGVYIITWAPSKSEAGVIARLASRALLGSISPLEREERIRVRDLSLKKLLKDLERLKLHGKTKLLLPKEAAMYFQWPRTFIGVPIEERALFGIPPSTYGELHLGEAIRSGRETGKVVSIPRQLLSKHLLIAGTTGSGKTNTCLNLLLHLHELGVPFLVISPVKREYRSLVRLIPEIRIFTLGNEVVAPFKFNPLEIPDGVNPQTHLDGLMAVFKASYVLYAPMPYVLEQCLERVYRKFGWDLVHGRRGKTPRLEDLYSEVSMHVTELGYEPKLTMDIEAALRTRLRSLISGAKGAMLNVESSIPLKELISNPTILELEDVGSSEEKALLMGLILVALYERLRAMGPSKDLRLVIAVEEAHRLLTNLETVAAIPDMADPRRKVVEQLCNMLAEMRAYGAGLIIVEQIPSKLAPDVLKNTGTKVVHRLLAIDDRQAVGKAMNLNEEQIKALVSLKVGEAVVYTEAHPLPFMVGVPNVLDSHGIDLSKDISDEEIREHMKHFYEEHPVIPYVEVIPSASFQRELTYESVATQIFVRSDRFRAYLLKVCEIAIRRRDPVLLAEFLFRTSKAYTGEEKKREAVTLAYHMLRLARAYKPAINDLTFVEEVEKALRRVGDSGLEQRSKGA